MSEANMTDEEIMRGFIAAALLMGPVIPAACQKEDPVEDYCRLYEARRFGPKSKHFFDYAIDIGYAKNLGAEGFVITEKGKEFFANADIPIAVPVPESSADDEA